MAERARILPMAVLDRINRGHHLISLLGPIELPGRPEFVAALVRIARLGPQARVGLQFAGTADAWRYDPEQLESWCDSIVTVSDESGPALVPAMLAKLVAVGGDGPPIQFVLAGDYVLSAFDHSLGDGDIMELIPAAIIALAAGGELPERLLDARIPSALWPALRHTFLKHPLAIARVISTRRAYLNAAPAAPAEAHRPDSAESLPEYYYTVADRTQLRELKRLTRVGGSAVSLTSLLLCLLRLGLERQGVQVASEAGLVLDSRRYLPPGMVSTGNFITGMPIRLEPDTVPSEVESQLAVMLRSGWPLATLATGAAKARLLSKPHASGRTITSPVRISLSNAGLQRGINELPWQEGTPPTAVFAVGPVPERQLSVSVLVLRSELHFTASFNGASIDRDDVKAAIDLVAHDPVALLPTVRDD